MDIVGETDGEYEDALKELESGGERDTCLPLGAFSFMQSFIFLAAVEEEALLDCFGSHTIIELARQVKMESPIMLG